MVRIKERYLLVNILYPPDPAATAREAPLPYSVVQHQPTVEKLTPAALLKAVRAQVATLFGDYGSGALEGHLSGAAVPLSRRPRPPRFARLTRTRLQSSTCP